MRAGALIAGSLIWDQHPLRVSWRTKRLRVDRRLRVPAPLRYGRCSSSRSGTYTMVFSPRCVDSGYGTGTALAVPFAMTVESVDDLVREATELWRAECKSDSEGRGVISAAWGSVGMVVRPDLPARVEWEAAWATAVSRSPRYGNLAGPHGDARAVDRQTGLAGFAWNALGKEAGGEFDVLLFAATKASLVDGRYPTPEEVAEAWRVAPLEAKYFKRNRDWGITTRQDAEIEARLGDVLADEHELTRIRSP